MQVEIKGSGKLYAGEESVSWSIQGVTYKETFFLTVGRTTLRWGGHVGNDYWMSATIMKPGQDHFSCIKDVREASRLEFLLKTGTSVERTLREILE